MSPPPLFCSTRPLPNRPVTLPPTTYEFVLQLIVTVLTLALTTVPVPPTTLQVWVGPDGWVLMVTAKLVPLSIAVGKTKLPVGPSTRSSPPLFCSTMLLPVRPTTLPPMVYLLVGR